MSKTTISSNQNLSGSQKLTYFTGAPEPSVCIGRVVWPLLIYRFFRFLLRGFSEIRLSGGPQKPLVFG